MSPLATSQVETLDVENQVARRGILFSNCCASSETPWRWEGTLSGNTPQCEFGALVSVFVSSIDSQSLADLMVVNLLQLVPRLLQLAH